MALPLPKVFWPVTITTGVNDKLDFRIGAPVYVAAIAAGIYYSAATLAAAAQAALTAAAANDWSVTVSTLTGRVTISGTTYFILGFGSGSNKAIDAAEILGFAAVDVEGTSVTGAHQHQNGWYPELPVTDDTGDLASWFRTQSRSHSGRVKTVQLGGTKYDRGVSFGFLSPHKIFQTEEGGYVNEALERLIESGYGRFRYWPDGSVEGTSSDYVLEIETAKRLLRNRLSPGAALYSYPLKFLRHV
jgi:hypothetical protein